MPEVIDLSALDPVGTGSNASPNRRKSRKRPGSKGRAIDSRVYIAVLSAVIVGALGFLIYHFTSGPPAQELADGPGATMMRVRRARSANPALGTPVSAPQVLGAQVRRGRASGVAVGAGGAGDSGRSGGSEGIN